MLVSRGGAQALSRMVANKPGAPGRLRISVKTVAQGMPVDRHHLWYLPPAFFSAGGPWVRPSPGIPFALCIFKGYVDRTTRASSAARTRTFVHCCLRCEADEIRCRPGQAATRVSAVAAPTRTHTRQ